MIEVDNLNFYYPTLQALDNINLHIRPRTITALVGPNGAGKTTLLNCLAALEKPFSGQIKIDGVITTKAPRQCHEKMGFLPDFFGLYDNITLRQTLTYFCMAHKMNTQRCQERVPEIASLINLSDKLDSKIGALSRGMRQRVAIGQVLAHYPPLLILDEPASGLDPEARFQLGNLLQKLRKEKGMTILVSSHILAELDQYATDMVILKNGKVLNETSLNRSTETITAPTIEVAITLTNRWDEAQKYLEELKAVTAITKKDQQLIITTSLNEDKLHQLLSDLIKHNFPVWQFSVLDKNLQEQYLSIINRRLAR